jgi:mono/diheme cytochrome c family protein
VRSFTYDRARMKKPIRIALTGLAVLIFAGVAAAIAISLLADRKLHRIVELPPMEVTLALAEGQLERGQYLFKTRGCMECHGADGGGDVVVDDKDSGFFVRAPNITAGAGSPAREYTDVDWVRAIRHGVKRSGEPIFLMPSDDYAQMTDADVGAIVAYVRSLPPVDTGGTQLRPLSLPFKALYLFGAIEDAAEKIDHSAAPPATVADDPLSRGRYAAQTCTGCHGRDLAGGKIPGAPPSWPPAANLTSAPDSAMALYTSAEQFKSMFRTGKRPDGSAVSEVMPFKSLMHMSDAELDDLFAYLKSVPGEKTGNR